ncbi:TPX2, C-terminal [Dillenia turbinata]|uniref:TPX2, C-terminal n=1 Tax=Dillenia turbinata TaxID=194707 RepID=A0AAN8YXD3_9MAGN
MGESACLIHALTHSSVFSYEAKEQGNPIYALGESISFGRFLSESLAWEKWSSFKNNRYVEEAERQSRPGFVAERKAYFEARYKTNAAKRAAALLDQASAANKSSEPKLENKACNVIQVKDGKFQNDEFVNDKVTSEVATDDIGTKKIGANLQTEHRVLTENIMKIQSPHQVNTGPGHEHLTLMCKNNALLSPSKSTDQNGTPKAPCLPAKATVTTLPKKQNNATPNKKSASELWGKTRSTPKSLHKSINVLTPAKEPNTARATLRSPKLSKDGFNSLQTPTKIVQSGLNFKYRHLLIQYQRQLQQPLNQKTEEIPIHRIKATPDPSPSGSKTVGSKWHFRSIDFPKSLSTCRKQSQSLVVSPASSRKGDQRSAKPKEASTKPSKMDEKSNTKKSQRAQLQIDLKEKAGAAFRKLHPSLCFKARPLPDFYQEKPQKTKEKTSLSSPGSPVRVRNHKTSTARGTSSETLQRPPIRTTGSKAAISQFNTLPKCQNKPSRIQKY